MFTPEIEVLARDVLSAARMRAMRITTAESCTGGLVAAALTAIAGSSDVVDRGFVTYSNAAKTEMLDVPSDLIARHGAVSEDVARAMAAGALTRSGADIAVSVTGIAGPGGSSADKPVGLVHIVAEREDAVLHRRFEFGDIGRDGVREKSVIAALELLRALL